MAKGPAEREQKGGGSDRNDDEQLPVRIPELLLLMSKKSEVVTASNPSNVSNSCQHAFVCSLQAETQGATGRPPTRRTDPVEDW